MLSVLVSRGDQLTRLGRVRRQGSRKRRHSSWHTVQGRRGVGTREACHQQAAQAWSEQEDSDSRQEHGHCKHRLSFNKHQPLTLSSRSLQGYSPTVATLSRELAMRRPSGDSSTKPPSPYRHSPTAWAATLRPTPSTLAYGHLVSQLSSQDGILRPSYPSMVRLVQDPQLAQAARRRARSMAVHHCT